MEHEIRRAAAERSAALIRKDVGLIRELLAKEFIYTNASGMVLFKDDYLAAYVENPEVVWHSQEWSDARVQVYGDTAVLTGLIHDRATWQGQSMDAHFRTTQVYVRRGDAWKYVAGQTTEAGE